MGRERGLSIVPLCNNNADPMISLLNGLLTCCQMVNDLTETDGER